MKFHIDPNLEIPKYKQVLSEIESMILDGRLKKGSHLPSMMDIAVATGMSKETVKRALVTLRDKGYIASCPGKGYYVSKDADDIPQQPNILMILGRLDIFKQLLVDSFTTSLMGKAEVKILLHNGEVDLLETYIEQHLDSYDYYVVSPHFDIDDTTQHRVARILSKIPNRKLIMLDHCNKFMTGQFGAVYQDFENDVAIGLRHALQELKTVRCLNAVVLPTSRYGEWALDSLKVFCVDNNIPYKIMHSFPETVEKGEVFLLFSGRLSNELANIDLILRRNGMQVGKDVGLVSYNDVPLNSVVLGGLTTISTDFEKMGSLAADMIIKGKMSKIRNDFRMVRRSTF